MSSDLTIDCVSKIKIYSKCTESDDGPCAHKCDIVLIDGRLKTVALTSASIDILMQNIRQDKLECKQDLTHFQSEWKTQASVNQILSKIFKENS